MHGWTLPGFVALDQPNLLGEPDAPGAMSFGASIDLENGKISAGNREGLHLRLAALARRMKGTGDLWTDALSDSRSGGRAEDPGDNPDMPAGYTYLLQLIAHDMVDSSLAPASAGSVANGRSRPLMLDTIYGFGPDSTPWAYDAEPTGPGDGFVTEHGRMPRNRLRTRRCTDGGIPAGKAFCPFHDIARSGDPVLTDPMIADPRNDAHPVMSQMTVLFHHAHNVLMAAINRVDLAGDASGVEVGYRRLACARAILTLIYRRIVRQDVLRRILDPAVWSGYAGARHGRPLQPFGGVSVEFSRGAFRFAHAMVRDRYVFNDFSQLEEATNFLLFSSRRKPEDMPLDRTWMVDWSLFFDLRSDPASGTIRNPSHRIGPRYGDLLEDSSAFKNLSAIDVSGLAHRDLLSALYAGQWSVPTLSAKLRTLARQAGSGLEAVQVGDYAVQWQPLIKAWLEQDFGGAAIAGPKLDAAAISAIAADPPWPFFVAFEAAFRGGDNTLSTAGMGRHLGPVGSLIVAETCFGALQSSAVIDGEWQMSLKQAIVAALDRYLGQTDLLPELVADNAVPPEDMSSFLHLLRDMGAFGGSP